MLQESKTGATAVNGTRITIIAPTYNAEYVDGMLEAALTSLADAGVREVELIRVPGAFEIPVVAAKAARRKRKRPSTVICLGVILRGETTHADHVGENVSRLLADIAVETGVPMVHEVLLLETKAQAKARCLNAKTNRGAEAAHTALVMAGLMAELK